MKLLTTAYLLFLRRAQRCLLLGDELMVYVHPAVYMQVSQGKENKTESVQLLSSAKLILKQLITRAKVSRLVIYYTAHNPFSVASCGCL